MNEQELLISRISDLKEKSADESVVTVSNFLSADEISLVSSLSRVMNKYVDTFYFGGYADAERCVAVFVPKFYECTDIGEFFAENPGLCSVCLIKITKDKFCSLGHRDYLGALMGLGIKREMLGDISVNEEGCYLFAMKSISRYICENLTKIGRGAVRCEVAPLSDFSSGAERVKEMFLSVPSLRLDCIVSGAFGLSRSAACDEIKKGTVFVNSLKVIKNDCSLKEGDKVVLRGKGKAVIKEITGESKKGRIHIKVNRYK